MGRRERRRFTDEVKAEVVGLARSGRAVAEASRDLDLTGSAVRTGVHRAEERVSSLRVAEREELSRLRRQVRVPYVCNRPSDCRVVMAAVGRQVGVQPQNFETVWRAQTFIKGMGPTGPRSTAILGLSLAVLVLMTACGGSLRGIPRQKAVALARVRAQQVSSTPVSLVRAASGPSGAFQTGTPRPQRMVWAVTFSGTFTPPSCGPAGSPPHTCPLSVHTVRIFVDAASGAFIFGQYPAKTS